MKRVLQIAFGTRLKTEFNRKIFDVIVYAEEYQYSDGIILLYCGFGDYMYFISITFLFLSGLIFPIFLVLVITSIFNEEMRGKIAYFVIGTSLTLLVFLVSAFLGNKFNPNPKPQKDDDESISYIFTKKEIKDNQSIDNDIDTKGVLKENVKYSFYANENAMFSATFDGVNYSLYDEFTGSTQKGVYEIDSDNRFCMEGYNYRLDQDDSSVFYKESDSFSLNIPSNGLFSATVYVDDLNYYIFEPSGSVSLYIGKTGFPFKTGVYIRNGNLIVMRMSKGEGYSSSQATNEYYYYDSARKKLCTTVFLTEEYKNKLDEEIMNKE